MKKVWTLLCPECLKWWNHRSGNVYTGDGGLKHYEPQITIQSRATCPACKFAPLVAKTSGGGDGAGLVYRQRVKRREHLREDWEEGRHDPSDA